MEKGRGSDSNGYTGKRHSYHEKQHPCGSKQWQVLRIGMDFKLKCLGCGHEVMLPRSKAEKNIRTVEREGEIVC